MRLRAGRRRLPGRWRSRMLVVVSGLLMANLALASCDGAPFAGYLAAAPTPLATATALPPAADANAAADQGPDARSFALGCVPNAPKPQPRIVLGGGYGGSRAPNEVALTFDDGPTPYSTPPILTELERTRTPATFFVLGLYARVWPDLIKREWNNGLFAIELHSWDHPLMSRQSDAQLQHQFGDTLVAMRAVMGPHACIWLWRPPYGDYNAHVVQVAARYGLTTVNWDDAGLDWTLPGAQVIANNVISELHPGAIILLHDGPANRQQTLAALPLILSALKARGLKPVTLPQLLADAHYPGVAVVGPAPLAPAWPTPAPFAPTATPTYTGTH